MENNNILRDEIVEAVDKRVQKTLDKRLGVFKDEIDRRFDGVDRQFKGIEQKIYDGFREQGVLMHKMQDDIDTLVDGQELLHGRIDRIDHRVARLEA